MYYCNVFCRDQTKVFGCHEGDVTESKEIIKLSTRTGPKLGTNTCKWTKSKAEHASA